MNPLDNLTWFGHASFLLSDSKMGKNFYYIDPFDLKNAPKDKADVVFITHAHYDHLSPNDIRKVVTSKTTLVGVNGCENLNLPNNKFLIVEPNREVRVAGITVQTVPAYNVKPDRLKYHPKENKWVGYIFNFNGKKIYHAGDTDFIPEMRKLYNIDVAMLPMGGTFTMDVNEAIQAANAIQADVTIPMHYKRLLNEKAKDAEDEFKSGVKGKVVLMKEFS